MSLPTGNSTREKNDTEIKRIMSIKDIENSVYQILEVDETATKEMLDKARLEKIRLVHPDKNRNNPNSTKASQILSSAYETACKNLDNPTRSNQSYTKNSSQNQTGNKQNSSQNQTGNKQKFNFSFPKKDNNSYNPYGNNESHSYKTNPFPTTKNSSWNETGNKQKFNFSFPTKDNNSYNPYGNNESYSYTTNPFPTTKNPYIKIVHTNKLQRLSDIDEDDTISNIIIVIMFVIFCYLLKRLFRK